MKHIQLFSFLALFAFNASAQNVGIGTSTPSDQLHTTGTVRFEKYKGSNTRMVQMDSSGRLVVTPAGAVFTYFSLAAVPDNGCAAGNGILSTITVAGQPLSVPSSNIAVRVNISHPWDSDLRIYLYPPTGGGVLVLASQNGADGDNFTNTLFTDQAAVSITTGIAPFTGQYRPKGGATACLQTGTALANFAAIGGGNVAPNGDWILKVFDGGVGDVGSLNDWSISFTGAGSLATDGENNYLPKFSAGNLVSSSLYESEGNNYIGIGTASPFAKLDIFKGNLRFSGDPFPGIRQGIQFTNAAGISSNGSFGPFNDSILGFSGFSGFKTLLNNINGNMGLQGNTNPRAPLSFASALGNKIALWGNADVGHYGIGVAGGALQLYSDGISSDIVFGYGRSSSFTEKMRVKGNGNVGIGFSNPTYILDVNGRMRIRHNAETAGLWFNKTTNFDDQGSFIGLRNDQQFGVFGNGTWKFAIDNADGTMYVGSPNLDSENFALGAGYKLRVYGKIISEEVRVQLKTAWPDYVFSKNYKLRSLPEIEKYIAENNHLPNIPAAAEVGKSGIALGEMQTKMMEKIEELTLYIIAQEKRILTLEKNISQSKK